jgi:SAM-dependent methyltransferase
VPNAEEIREAQRTAWAGLSVSWAKWDTLIQQQLGPVGAAIIDRLDVADDQQHLDIASGTGEPGLSIATLAPNGRTVLTDLSTEMLDVAKDRAAARGICNIETAVCSADDLPFADSTFDSISVRFGYMFFPDLAAATGEFARVLRPGGRICASVWVEPEANPWTSIALQAAAAEAAVALPTPSPDTPGMFRCAAPGLVGGLYTRAGFRDVTEWDVPVELVTESPEQYWSLIGEHASVVATALKNVDQDVRERVRARVISEVSAYAKDREVRVPGRARCIAGTK